VNVLYELKLDFAVAIRSNHAVWLPRKQTFGIIDGENLSASSVMVRQNFATSEIIFGKRRAQQFWELTTDPETCQRMERGM